MRYTHLHICPDGLKFRNKRFCQALILHEIYFDWTSAFDLSTLAAHIKEAIGFESHSQESCKKLSSPKAYHLSEHERKIGFEEEKKNRSHRLD